MRYALIVLLLLGAGRAVAAEADLIVHNAKVVTVDEKFRLAEAVAVADGRVTAVGDNAAVLKLKGPKTRVIDAGGRTVLPGLYDSHVHLMTPRLIRSALSGGITTLITAGWEEPPWRWQRMVEAFEPLPVCLRQLTLAGRGDVVEEAPEMPGFLDLQLLPGSNLGQRGSGPVLCQERGDALEPAGDRTQSVGERREVARHQQEQGIPKGIERERSTFPGPDLFAVEEGFPEVMELQVAFEPGLP